MLSLVRPIGDWVGGFSSFAGREAPREAARWAVQSLFSQLGKQLHGHWQLEVPLTVQVNALFWLSPLVFGPLPGCACLRRRRPRSKRDHLELTSLDQMEPGRFLLVARGQEFDEVLLGAQFPGPATPLWLCYSTIDDGSRFGWFLVSLELGNWRGVVHQGGRRNAPPGVEPNNVNWICTPPRAWTRWNPSKEERDMLAAEALNNVTVMTEDNCPGQTAAGSQGR